MSYDFPTLGYQPIQSLQYTRKMMIYSLGDFYEDSSVIEQLPSVVKQLAIADG